MEENDEMLINEKNTLTSINVLVIILSIYVLSIFIIETIFTLPSEILKVLDFVDNIICVFFLIDFFIRFYKAENKLQFMK